MPCVLVEGNEAVDIKDGWAVEFIVEVWRLRRESWAAPLDAAGVFPIPS